MNSQKELRQFLVTMDKKGNSTWVENGEFVSNPLYKTGDLPHYYNSFKHILDMESVDNVKIGSIWDFGGKRKYTLDCVVTGTKIIEGKRRDVRLTVTIPNDKGY